IGDAVDVQLVVDGIDFLGAYALDAEHLEFDGGSGRSQFIIEGYMARFDGFFDAFDDSWSQAGHAFELAFARQLFDVAVECVDGAGCILVSTHFKRAAALFQFEQGSNLIQQIGDLILIHAILYDTSGGAKGDGLTPALSTQWRGSSRRPYNDMEGLRQQYPLLC